ncbi:MAG: hypothetical protein ISP90_04745 [Nevskia sp.]|nr:hypothetical protein [Nevskia sp.]
MQLSDIDDLPFHQAPTPFNVAATSDVHFNDGYYHAIFAQDWYMSIGLRLHPNVNVIDGFVTLAHKGEQRSCRFSRVLRPRHTELAIGPLKMEVTERMRRTRLALADSPAGLSFDLELEAVSPPYFEAPYHHRRFGILINDLVRYTMVCRASGSIVLDGLETKVDRWHAIRDHSWGIRASMGPHTSPRGVDEDPSDADLRRFRLWVPFEVEGHAGFFQTHEAEDGSTLDFEGALFMADGRQVPLTGVRHRLRYAPGTHNVLGGEFDLRHGDGSWHTYRISLAGTPADVQGGGYYSGWNDGKRTGMYRGAGPVIEYDRYACGPELGVTGAAHIPAKRHIGPSEFPMFLTGPDGARGMAHFEHYIFGPYQPYGFT